MQAVGHLESAPPKPRILFVDDEPMILRSIRRLLSAAHAKWEMLFVGSGTEALEAMEDNDVDVIVSDMHMEEMNGAELLTRVQRLHPQVVRIVLSGHTDQKLVYRTVPVAHQFLSKPFDPELLRSTLVRACDLRGLLESESMRKMVGRTNDLPSAPTAYTNLINALSDPDVSVMEVGAIIERDVALSAKVTQIVSSAFFGLPKNVSSIRGAVAYLGIDTIKALMLTVEIFTMFRIKKRVGFDIENFQRRSLVTAQLARKMLAGYETADDAFLAGILHDVGQLIIASRMPDSHATIKDLAVEQGLSRHEAETQVLGVTHSDVGAYLLGLWGLPQLIVEAVAHHHSPGAVDEDGLGVVTAVEVASVLADEAEPNQEDRPTADDVQRCTEHLESKGLAERLPEWRKMAREIRSRSSDEGDESNG